LFSKDYYGTNSFRNWNSYNVTNTQVLQVKNLEYNSSVQRVESFKKNILNLSSTIPAWLENKEVLNEIKDVQK
jgi:hypothetical protein